MRCIFKMLKVKICLPRILYPAGLSFKNEGELKALQVNKNREFSASRPAVQEIIKDILQAGRK